jgi:prevent-host-death family protein
MSKTINLRDANQGFSRRIREVEAGEEFVITRNGKRVARHMPVEEAALARIGDTTWPLNIGRFNRDDIYKGRYL